MERKFITISKHDSGIRFESGKMFSFFLHSHTYYEMTLYDAIEGSLSLNDHTIYPQSMTAVLIAPSYFHKGTVIGKRGKYRKLVFDSEFLPQNLLPKTSIILKDIKDDDFLVKLYDEIEQNACNEEYKKMLLGAAVCIMLQEGEMLIPSKGRSIGLEAVRIINEKFNMPLTLSDVANQLYITPQYLSNTFKKELNMTFSAYLTAVRLRRAEKLLIETSETVTNICENCGYGNFSHFLRSFKKIYGISPTMYRQQNKS